MFVECVCVCVLFQFVSVEDLERKIPSSVSDRSFTKPLPQQSLQAFGSPAEVFPAPHPRQLLPTTSRSSCNSVHPHTEHHLVRMKHDRAPKLITSGTKEPGARKEGALASGDRSDKIGNLITNPSRATRRHRGGSKRNTCVPVTPVKTFSSNNNLFRISLIGCSNSNPIIKPCPLTSFTWGFFFSSAIR